MSNTAPVTFTLQGIGEVTMTGTGPWRVRVYNPASCGIVDSTNQETPPSVRSKARLSKNVIFSQEKDALAVVAQANSILLADQAQF